MVLRRGVSSGGVWNITTNVAESANTFISDLCTLHATHLFAADTETIFVQHRSLHTTLRPDALQSKPAAFVEKGIFDARLFMSSDTQNNTSRPDR